jgi:hypothetical protein
MTRLLGQIVAFGCLEKSRDLKCRGRVQQRLPIQPVVSQRLERAQMLPRHLYCKCQKESAQSAGRSANPTCPCSQRDRRANMDASELRWRPREDSNL